MPETRRKLSWIIVGAVLGAILSNATDVFTTPALSWIYAQAFRSPSPVDQIDQQISNRTESLPNKAQCSPSPSSIAATRSIRENELVYPTESGGIKLSTDRLTSEQLNDLSKKMGEAMAKGW